MTNKPLQPGMYVRFSDRVVQDDPAAGGGAFGRVGDPLAVGGFLAHRARAGLGVYDPQDMTPVAREDVPAEELADIDAAGYRPDPADEF